MSHTVVQLAVSDYFQLPVEQLRAPTRSGTARYGKESLFSTARHIARYLEREVYGLTYTQIGELYGTDHTTALASFRHMQARLAVKDARYAEHVRIIRGQLGRTEEIPRAVASLACPTCGAPVIQELQRQIAALTARLSEMEKR